MPVPVPNAPEVIESHGLRNVAAVQVMLPEPAFDMEMDVVPAAAATAWLEGLAQSTAVELSL